MTQIIHPRAEIDRFFQAVGKAFAADTKQSLKAKQLKKLATAMVTTSESLSLMLTDERLHDQLAGVQTVIVDEPGAIQAEQASAGH